MKRSTPKKLESGGKGKRMPFDDVVKRLLSAPPDHKAAKPAKKQKPAK